MHHEHEALQAFLTGGLEFTKTCLNEMLSLSQYFDSNWVMSSFTHHDMTLASTAVAVQCQHIRNVANAFQS